MKGSLTTRWKNLIAINNNNNINKQDLIMMLRVMLESNKNESSVSDLSQSWDSSRCRCRSCRHATVVSHAACRVVVVVVSDVPWERTEIFALLLKFSHLLWPKIETPVPSLNWWIFFLTWFIFCLFFCSLSQDLYWVGLN